MRSYAFVDDLSEAVAHLVHDAAREYGETAGDAAADRLWFSLVSPPVVTYCEFDAPEAAELRAMDPVERTLRLADIVAAVRAARPGGLVH